jgi:hypothetical protein
LLVSEDDAGQRFHLLSGWETDFVLQIVESVKHDGTDGKISDLLMLREKQRNCIDREPDNCMHQSMKCG